MTINNKEVDIKRAFKAQKIALYWLLSLIYLSFIGLQLGRIQALANFNYNLHEIMYLPFNIALYVVPVLLLIYIILWVNYIRKKRTIKFDFKTIVLTISIILSIIIIVTITEYQFQEVTTSGIFKVEQKIQEGKDYYLEINDQKIRVSKNEFQLVEVNKEYHISYVWNKRAPNIGEIKTISLWN